MAGRISSCALPKGLFVAMGIEFGNGGVYVSEATDIVFLKDTDGDGKADSREIILSGFGTADSHQMVNNIHRGPCGDFWFTQGHHALFSRGNAVGDLQAV